jgi:hypothetical protein
VDEKPYEMFASTLVVKIKKTQESTPSVPIHYSVMPKKNNEDVENIILLPVDSGLFCP